MTIQEERALAMEVAVLQRREIAELHKTIAAQSSELAAQKTVIDIQTVKHEEFVAQASRNDGGEVEWPSFSLNTMVRIYIAGRGYRDVPIVEGDTVLAVAKQLAAMHLWFSLGPRPSSQRQGNGGGP